MEGTRAELSKSSQQRRLGTLVKYWLDRGYGFINEINNGFKSQPQVGIGGDKKDIWFHVKELEDIEQKSELKIGSIVSYIHTAGPKGPCATEVLVLDPDSMGNRI
jgi:cold shock CspA family protein